MSDDPTSSPFTVHRLLSVVGLFVAPTSLITGICFYFGAVSTRRRLDYYGVDPQSLGLTTRDYVVASIEVLYFPILRLLLVVATLVFIVILIRRLATAGRYILAIRVTAWGLTIAGVAALGTGALWLMFGKLLVEDATPNFTGWSILLGVGLLFAGWWSLSTIREQVDSQDHLLAFTNLHRALLGIGATGIVVTLFWLTNIYAADEGYRRGEFDARGLWAKETAVILDSAEPLAIPDYMVKRSVLPGVDPASKPILRYECLRVLKVVGDTWLLVPAKWERAAGYTLMVTPSASQRITPTVREGAAASTGRAENITRFWQCPEVVRTFNADELDAMLLDADEAHDLLDNYVPTAWKESDQTSSGNTGPALCEAAWESQPTDSRVREMAALGAADETWLHQRVMRFADPLAAAQMVAKVHERWQGCRNQVVGVSGRDDGQSRTFGGVGRTDDILTVVDSVPDGSGEDCAQSIAAKSNVVIEARYCGDEAPLSGRVVEAVRNKIPT
ncbi:hypothetical protein BH10ACT9_BH10ACT9_09340 [soil metagenome]